MIGINIRGFRHLWRLAGPSIKEVMVEFKDYDPSFCHVIKTDKYSNYGEVLLLFNRYYSNSRASVNDFTSNNIMSEEESNFINSNYSRVVVFNNYRVADDFPYILNLTLLPDTFEKDYSNFLSVNAKMIRTLTNKFGYDANQDISKRAFMYSEGSKNFYQWVVSAYFQNGASMASISRVMNWNKIYGQMAKNLKKNTITAYTSKDDFSSLMEETRILRREKRINDVVNMFNTAQKKILRSKADSFSDKDKDVLSKFYRLSKTKKINFIRKMSTINDYDEIMRQMCHITSAHFDWNKDSFMDFIKNIEGIKYETIMDNDNIVLVKVDDYETVKYLAKTTNWCISKNKTYWNQYVEHIPDSTQYMIFDFSKKEDDLLSIIGFTTEYNKGITHAHDFSNNDILGTNNNDQERQFLRSFIQKLEDSSTIYDVLRECNIDINIVAKYEKPMFEWDKDAMFSYLYECVDKRNVDILRNEGDLVALSICDENVKYFLGDSYIDNVPENNWGLQHIVFMDFSMNQYDPNRIVFAVIETDYQTKEDYCSLMLNEHLVSLNPFTSFNNKLDQYSLPYDIIRRNENVCNRIKSAFLSYNAPLLNSLLHNSDKNDIKRTFTAYIDWDTVENILSHSVVKFMSFDMLDAFYNNDIRISDLMECTNVVNSLTGKIFGCLVSHCDGIGVNYGVPTEHQVQRFLNNKCESNNEIFYIGSYLALKKIIKNEGKSNVPKKYGMYKQIIVNSAMSSKNGDVLDELLMDMAPQIDFSLDNSIIEAWLRYAYRKGTKTKEFVHSILKYKSVKEMWNSFGNNGQGSINEPIPHFEDCYDLGDELEADYDFVEADTEAF